MAAPDYSLISTSSNPTPIQRRSIDLKANGEVSRMRSHKGNMPSLPQTKYCPLCPAKFTRTTHLNRHLRSHTNERLHRCNTCQSQFTRSDLLTRHKRTCGDSLNVNRSRRKSCQACAESKIKCDLQYPCAKCTSRGRECIFINDPEASRIKRIAASKKASQQSNSPKSSPETSGTERSTLPGPVPFTMPSLDGPQAHSPSRSNDYSSSLASLSPFNSSYPKDQFEPPMFSSSSGSSSASSSHASPCSDIYNEYQDVHNSFDLSFDTLTLDTHLNRLFSTTMFNSFLDQSNSPASTQSAPAGPHGDFSWMEGSDFHPTLSRETVTCAQAFDDQVFMSPTGYSSSASSTASPNISTLDNMFSVADFDTPTIPHAVQPPPAELQHYLYLFFSAFLAQVPIVHSPTWQMENKPPILIRAMQACGALFVKTRTALNFISETLASTRDVLLQEFSRTPTDATEQTNLILAVVLLQTIGLFHQRSDQRVSSNVYHGMLVMMIRRSGIINKLACWTPPALNEQTCFETVWREWSAYETIKRAILLSYLHDCCHCMYFSLYPSFQPAELDINLPCDDAVWRAGSAREWFDVLQIASPYGTGESRLLGIGMQQALAALGNIQPPTFSLALNPFSHFILIHTILRNLYESRAEKQPLDVFPPSCPTSTSFGVDMDRVTEDQETLFITQYALDNWLQTWVNSPESMEFENGMDEPPFICNALPFYWLAQVSLLALQEGNPLGATYTDAKAESRFHLMKQWLEHIRSFLRKGDKVPAHVWDELMKFRGQLSRAENQSVVEDQEGLLAFFPEH